MKVAKNKANSKPICQSVFVQSIHMIFERRIHIVAIKVKCRYFDRLYGLVVQPGI